jgi:hypothetical protein
MWLCLWTAASNGRLVHPPRDMCEWRATAEWYWQGKPKNSEEKLVPVPFYPAHISHGLTRARGLRDEKPAINEPPEPRHGHAIGEVWLYYRNVWTLVKIPFMTWLQHDLTLLFLCLCSPHTYGVIHSSVGIMFCRVLSATGLAPRVFLSEIC